jgi:hypothetical protein
MLKTQIKPSSVVPLHDTYSSTVDLVYQFLPVLIANGHHMVTVGHLLGAREPGSSYGGRENGPPVNDIRDISAGRYTHLAATRHPSRRRTCRSPTCPTKTPAAHSNRGQYSISLVTYGIMPLVRTGATLTCEPV